MLLVGGSEHVLFFHVLGRISPTDELIFFRGVGIPPTRLAVDVEDHNRDHMFEVSSGMCKMCHAIIDHH
jgi:hypothetical protein